MLAGLVAAVGLILPASAGAATIVVNSTADSLTPSGSCTLRSAIVAAETAQPRGGCPAGSAGADTIRIGVTGTVNLVDDLPQIGSVLTIAGPEEDPLEVSGQSLHRPFTIGPAGEVEISRLVISNGSAPGDHFSSQGGGGGIRNAGELTLVDAIVSANEAVDFDDDGMANAGGGGIFSTFGSSLSLLRTAVADNTVEATSTAADEFALASGGGIRAEGELAIDESVIVFNQASADGVDFADASGPGISSTGETTIASTSVTSNSGTSTAAAGNALGAGGGIDHTSNTEGTLTLDRATIAGNSLTATGTDPGTGVLRGGGLSVVSADATVTSSTIAGNDLDPNGAAFGANVRLNATSQAISFRSTVVAYPAGASNCEVENGAFTSLGFNLEDDALPANNCNFVTASDQSDVDPQLEELGGNGGFGATMLPAESSPLVDAGLASADETTDQRGYQRPREINAIPNASGSDGSDIGAVELQTTLPDPAALDFGSVLVGGQFPLRTLTVTNAFSSPVVTGVATVSGTDANAFGIVEDGCAAQTLDPGDDCTIEIEFGPQSLGPKSAQLILPDNSSNDMVVPLTGVYVQPPPPPNQPSVTILSAKVKHRKRIATFRFRSNQPGSRFQCKLDRKAFAACRSPRTYRKLRKGKHTFRVRAINPAGETGPAKTRAFRVKVIKKKRR